MARRHKHPTSSPSALPSAGVQRAQGGKTIRTKPSQTMNIQTVIDSERGCGWRKPGGIYLRCDGISTACGKMPIPLTVCPCCHAGIKPSRGWTWFNPRPFVESIPCKSEKRNCNSCILSTPPEKAGLLWIGEKFYPTPEDWSNEAMRLGISRRISALPKGFDLGTTWVFVAHRKVIPGMNPPQSDCPLCKGSGGTMPNGTPCACRRGPGIFHVFKPSRVEYVVKGNESEEKLEDLVKRGITPVKVKREGELPIPT